MINNLSTNALLSDSAKNRRANITATTSKPNHTHNQGTDTIDYFPTKTKLIDIIQIRQSYIKIFNNNINILKAILFFYVDQSINAEDTNDETTINLIDFREKIAALKDFNFNENFYKKMIKVCDFGINVDTMLSDANTNNVEQYKRNASVDGHWLSREEIILYMLHKGYILINQGVSDDPDYEYSNEMKTVLAFQNLLEPKGKIYISNDAEAQLQNQTSRANGIHWFHVIPVLDLNISTLFDKNTGKPSIVRDYKGVKYLRNTSAEISNGNCAVNAIMNALGQGNISKDANSIRIFRKKIVEIGCEYIKILLICEKNNQVNSSKNANVIDNIKLLSSSSSPDNPSNNTASNSSTNKSSSNIDETKSIAVNNTTLTTNNNISNLLKQGLQNHAENNCHVNRLFIQNTLHISKSYVNLAIVKNPDDEEKKQQQEQVNNKLIQSEIYRHERQQSYESLYQEKKTVTLENMFKDNKHQYLIIGAPGVGKTTFMPILVL